MQDCLNRNIDYMRISLTDRCNLRCVYCMPEEGVTWVPHSAILTYEEILRLCRIFASAGITKVKLTGGEPLLRKGVAGLVRDIKNTPGIANVTMTTNGVLLDDLADDLISAGLDAVTVSLDTLDREMFQAITRRDSLEPVLRGLYKCAARPEIRVKLNVVPMGRNDDQLVPLAALARDLPISVRFIEMMPIGLGKDLPYRSEADVRALLERAYGPMTPYEGDSLGNGPCHYFDVPGFQGRIGFISAISHQFCSQCNRVRLTAEGFLKTCLQYETGTDLRALLHQGRDDETIRRAVELAIYNKPKSHHFTETAPDSTLEKHTMSQIGG